MLGLGFLQLAAKEKMKKFGVEERAVPVHRDTGDIAPFRRDFFRLIARHPPRIFPKYIRRDVQLRGRGEGHTRAGKEEEGDRAILDKG